MKTTLYQKTRTGKIQQWEIWVEKRGKSGFPEVWVEFGQVDGKKQTTFDIIKPGVNIGKANETTPVEQAGLEMARAITKQKEEGYCDTVEDAQREQTIDFDQELPKNLCWYKPKNSIDESKIVKLEKAGKLIKTVKRDGMMHVVRKTTSFAVEIYTRRMDAVTPSYPHLVPAFQKLPADTILLGEIILNNDGRDNFNGVSQICRSDPEEAQAKQDVLGKVSYYVFDVAIHNGVNCLTTMPYKQRLEIIDKLVKTMGSQYVLAVERINKTHAEAMKEVMKRKLEGLVLWDSEGIMGDGEAFTFNGKAYRPNMLWKSKPKYEDDFIVRWDPDHKIGDYGKGKNKGKIKNVFIYQIDDDENAICLGKCGGGLSDAQRDFYTDVSKFPRVWRIEYDSIQPKTGKLRFPVFNADRTLSNDKQMSECLMSDAIKAARAMDAEEEDGDESEPETE